MSEHEPQLQQREAQPYVAIAAHVPTEADFRRAADRGFPALFGWLGEHGVEPAGPLFIRYVEIDDDGEPIDVELAVRPRDRARPRHRPRHAGGVDGRAGADARGLRRDVHQRPRRGA